MKVILSARGSGKTTEAIKIAAKNYLYIVCHSQNECHRIARQAKEMNLQIPFPCTFDDLLRKQYHAKYIRGIVIDNVDMLLRQIVPDLYISAVTLNKNTEKSKFKLAFNDVIRGKKQLDATIDLCISAHKERKKSAKK